MTARLVGVGVGPGDPELCTVKAVRVLREADRVFVPVMDADEVGRAEETVRAHAGHDRIERLVFALNERTDTARRERHWDAAGRRVADYLRAAGPATTAVFATIGDPNVYSTFTYLAHTVAELMDVTVETVPGITAMQALAARSGVPLVEGTESLTLLPLARGTDGLAEALAGGGSVVAYKGGRILGSVVDAVTEAGRLDDAVFGAHLGLPDEVVVPLSGVDTAAAPYLSAVLIPGRRNSRGGKL
ncbi:MAG TPA: precorrin-2 C(20)-methyltransferase [Mycobacteriales bacterium]|jgi:precorrin-2/cobalt-factor-2 C20-methyltransferase